MPRSTYYYHVKQMQKPDKYAAVKENITLFTMKTRGGMDIVVSQWNCITVDIRSIIKQFRD